MDDGSSTWIPTTNAVDLNEVSGCWHFLDPTSSIVGFWGVDQWMEYIYLYLFPTLLLVIDEK